MAVEWEHPTKFPPLLQGEVQVWRIDLSEVVEDNDAAHHNLSPEEAERAGRLRAGQVRMQFLVGRNRVRALLGAHLGIASEDVRIVPTKYGKPELAPPYAGRAHFNVAHSRSAVLIALRLEGPVGIDIEYLDRKTEFEEVARHSLTDQETAAMMAIGDMSIRSQYFFDRWTKKEAVVKADGRGLSLPLTSFEIPAESGSRPLPLLIPDEDQPTHRTYFVSSVPFDSGAACALATVDQPCPVRLLRFPVVGLAP